MAALAYAEVCGLSVFPIAPGTKIPLKGSHGELDGTTDLDTIDSWWRLVPDAGIAVALRFTPYFVLDVDARAGGDAWWQAMIGADKPPTDLICESGSGWPSAHYWFRRSPRLEGYHAKQVPHAPGVDLKGLPFGYVALPPTLHKSGKEYAWWDGCEPVNAEPPNPPRWLEDAILLGANPLTESSVSFDMGLTFPRALELLAEGWPIGQQVGPGRWLCECPNAAQHSSDGKRRNDSSCVLFAPSRPGGWGRIYCSHGHCGWVR
jgi:hypothetical protein